MIKSRTYNGQAGLNYIQSSDLAFAIVYVVKREGTQYDKYISGSTNRTYIFQDSLGRISFPTSFAAGGEKVFVIFKTSTGSEPETPPGVCEPVLLISTPMPLGMVGQPYEYTLLATGSQPRTISNIVAPAWASVYPYAINGIKVSGTPDTETTETVSFDVSNACGTASFSENFNVVAGTVNFFIGGRFLTAIIQSVTGPDYELTSGSLPAIANAEGVHDAYTGTISVGVSGIVFPVTLRLQRNGGLLEDIPVASNGTYVFASQTYLSTDEISIFFT